MTHQEHAVHAEDRWRKVVCSFANITERESSVSVIDAGNSRVICLQQLEMSEAWGMSFRGMCWKERIGTCGT